MVAPSTERQTGAENVVWDLSVFYSSPDDPAIQRDMDTLMERVSGFEKTYHGRVASLDSEEMMDALVEIESLEDAIYRIGSYVSLLFSEDTTNPQYGALRQKFTEYGSSINQKMLFFPLEWNVAPEEQAHKLLNDPTLQKYRYYLESSRRYASYQLTEMEEKLLTETSVTGGSAWTRFFTQLMGAMRFEYEGRKITQSEVLRMLYMPDRETRRKAADSMTAGLREKSMELTYIFNVLLHDKAQDDSRRGYASWISSRNLSNQAPDEVVEALVQSVIANYDIVARHYNLKRTLLGMDELTDYDRYAPLPLNDRGSFYTWDEARDIVLNAYRSFSPRMAEIAQMFFDENWIHAKLAPAKRGGAFASPTVPSAHPFVLINYTGVGRDVATLAHELGHGVHQYLSASQGILNAYPPLTTSEMASVFGEMLVFQDLMARETSPEARLAMLLNKIEDAFATVFRQISMNRFEDAMHNARRSEGELTTERLSALWMDTQKAMFGDSVTLRDDYGLWWSYIPHFLNTPGYVYAYAFGDLLVRALYAIYQQRGADFVPQYIDVLAAGGSDAPDRILAKAGVDLTDLNFWNQGLNALREWVDLEEKLAREIYPEKFA